MTIQERLKKRIEFGKKWNFPPEERQLDADSLNEIDRLKAAIAEAERERERDEAKAAAPSRPDREALAKVAYKAWQDRAANFRPYFTREDFDGLELEARENWCGIAEAVAAAIPPSAPAAPAAIVCVEHEPRGETCTVDVHAFEQEFDPASEALEDDARKRGLMSQIFFVRQWHWHPAAPAESGGLADG